MGETMDCVALTGISKYAIKELLANGIRTLEIRSPHNFVSLLQLRPDDIIFLTETCAPDIVAGTKGLLARVKKIQVVMHKQVQSGANFYEEIEAQAARAQLQAIGHGRVRNVKELDLGSAQRLDVDEVCYYDAG